MSRGSSKALLSVTRGVLSLRTYPKVEMVKAQETISKNCTVPTIYKLLRAHRSTCIGWTSLPVSEGTEGNSLRIAKRVALANELERSRESTWDLSSHNTRVVAK